MATKSSAVSHPSIMILSCVVIAIIVFLAAWRAYKQATVKSRTEAFVNHFLAPASYDHPRPIGPYDDRVIQPNNGSTWRGIAPDMPHVIDHDVPSGEGLYLFYNNQCRPECCPSSYSCGQNGGCLCSTPMDRDLINTRGGNRPAGSV